ncbi:hypothetical protein CFOL_v3_22534, partial [Cephalotus follicularis]
LKRKDNVVDVSSFFRFEDTADSEDFDATNMEAAATMDHDDDDARSCSYDFSNPPCVCEYIKGCKVQACVGDDDDVDDDREEEGEEAHSYTPRPNQHKVLPINQKSSVPADTDLVNDMEDKVFWETCLAS